MPRTNPFVFNAVATAAVMAVVKCWDCNGSSATVPHKNRFKRVDRKQKQRNETRNNTKDVETSNVQGFKVCVNPVLLKPNICIRSWEEARTAQDIHGQ